jgi:hypothetical protein
VIQIQYQDINMSEIIEGEIESSTTFTLDTSSGGSDTISWSSGQDPFGIQQPVYAGAYEIGGGDYTTSFSLGEKPSFINRWFCKWCLGWEWVDN